MTEEKKKSRKTLKIVLRIFLLLVLITGGMGGWWFWKIYYQPNTITTKYLYIRTGETYEQLLDDLANEKFVADISTFKTIAKLKKFSVPKPGRYEIKSGMSNRELVNMLRAGLQSPVQFTFNNVRTKEKLAGRVGKFLEADSNEVLQKLNDPSFCAHYGFDLNTIMTMFIPNTYQFNWNTSADQFFDRMAQEYKKFWTDDRKAKAKAAGLTQSDVVILASIVQAEQSVYADERPTIAGLYINRLNKGMALQSDPTVIYALGDYSIKRLTDDDLNIDSPYNTYRHTGLPPGPILMPETVSVDAVLNYTKSNYIYMCSEFGTNHHKFTDNLADHLKNAQAYHNALNKANIKR